MLNLQTCYDLIVKLGKDLSIVGQLYICSNKFLGILLIDPLLSTTASSTSANQVFHFFVSFMPIKVRTLLLTLRYENIIYFMFITFVS